MSATKGAATMRYDLTLYVSGASQKAKRVEGVVREFCEKRLTGGYRLEVVDVQLCPDRADEDGVLVVPTLIRRSPPPIRRIIGDLGGKGEPLGQLASLISGGELPPRGRRVV